VAVSQCKCMGAAVCPRDMASCGDSRRSDLLQDN
jgi:hypothetical protein